MKEQRRPEAVLSLVDERIQALDRALAEESSALAMRTNPVNAAFTPPERIQESRDEVARLKDEIAFWKGARAYAAERLLHPIPALMDRRLASRKAART